MFEQYRIALKRDKDAIDIEREDEINRNRLFFDFMLIMFDHINQLYEKEKSLLIDTILKYHLRKESVEENTSKPSPSRKESAKGNTSKPSPRKVCFADMTNRNSQANSDSYKTNSDAKKVHIMK